MTHKAKVLRLLSDRKPHSHHELYALGCVAHSRVSDLRKDGYRIDQWRENGDYLYRLVKEEPPPVESEAVDPEPLALFTSQRGAYDSSAYQLTGRD